MVTEAGGTLFHLLSRPLLRHCGSNGKVAESKRLKVVNFFCRAAGEQGRKPPICSGKAAQKDKAGAAALL